LRIDLVGTTADFRHPGSRYALPLNHLLGENRETAGRIGEVRLIGGRRWHALDPRTKPDFLSLAHHRDARAGSPPSLDRSTLFGVPAEGAEAE